MSCAKSTSHHRTERVRAISLRRIPCPTLRPTPRLALRPILRPTLRLTLRPTLRLTLRLTLRPTQAFSLPAQGPAPRFSPRQSRDRSAGPELNGPQVDTRA